MELPFYTLIIVYTIGVLVFFILTILDVYHLVRYESFTTRAKVYLTVYVLFFVSLVAGAILLVGQTDWADTFTFFGNGTGI